MIVPVTLVYPFDPLGHKVGGIETFLRGFIAYAPPALDIYHVGIVSANSERPVRTWHEVQIRNRPFNSYAAFHERDENRRTRIPLGLRFTLSLYPARQSLFRGVVLFSRIEPAYVFRSIPNPRIGFVHNDIQEQLGAKSEYAWRHSKGLYFAMEGAVVSTLDHMYVVNSRAVEFYHRQYPRKRDCITFLPTWVDEGVFGPPEGSANGVKEELAGRFEIPVRPKWILYVGRFQRQKDPLLLVRTVARYMSRSDGDAVLVLVGEGNMKPAMVALAEELGIRDRLYFLGFLPQQELRRFYQAADSLLLTSEFEGMPRAALEALGCGLPVVSTPSGDIHRVLFNGKSGELINERDPEALAMGLTRVLQRDRSSWVENCLNAVGPFRPRVVLEDVYRQCITLGGTPPQKD